MIKKCFKCSQNFNSPHSKRRFCSQSCYFTWKSEDWHPSKEHLKKLRMSNLNRKYEKKSIELREKISIATKKAMSRPDVKKNLGKNKGWRKYSPAESLARYISAKSCRGFLRRARIQKGFSKKSQTFKILGYFPLDLKIHLEKKFKPGMSWENHGSGAGKWHIDHIRPVSSFPPDSPVREINALENLQPLWEFENLSKGSKF